ncbi:MAG: copper homeostasis protein CutC [Lactobacillales bacterium]|nr:copper homeostasis protein CutC [Lactobacillales bacterium]
MLKEFCAENFTHVPEAIQAGVNRIELCDNLAFGGTTPSTGVIEETVKYAHEHNVPIMTIIRPRGGDFYYNDIELKIMELDILEAVKRGTDGIVLGALDENNWIDEEVVENLLIPAEGLQTTFHMAFDSIDPDRQFEAIDWLVDHEFDNILTHGDTETTKIEQNFDHLKELVDYAGDRINILVGGGVRFDNYEQVVAKTGTKNVHGTSIVKI